MIPICDVTEQYRFLKRRIDAAVCDVFAHGQYINGPNVHALENEVAAYLGARYAVGVNSGTDALHLALRALDIGPGDEVITSPFTFIASSEAIGLVGAKPVFADIDPQRFTISPEAIENAIGPRTRAILPVHLYGLPAPMPEICRIAERYGLAVVEDCAQAIGASIDGRRVGTFGEFGALSFFPSKNLGAYGDGGMIVTSRPDLADRVRSLRAHGGRVKYHHEELGVNSRLDEVQAAILRVKLPHLESWLDLRRLHARGYDAALRDALVTPFEPERYRHVYHQYTVRLPDRDAVQRRLGEHGIQSMVYYPVPLHLQRVHAALGHRAGDFPHAEFAAREVLSLPMYPELSDEQRRRVSELLRASLALVAL
ncbi:MAG: DegT/DnrJ/EryC1/StrS family aminotransferase [bacterium]|nr:DegT/DnrJ/EryC1/StrS family aminotransferase [bacterium]